MPSVTVIITCYNLERFIGPAIESVLAQQGEPPQILVVDDASTDGSLAVARRYPVEIVQQPTNGGVLNAMLRGLEMAQGEILCLLDGDDLWEPGKLDAIRQAFAADPSLVFLTHDLRYMDEEGRPIDRPTRVAEAFGGTAPAEWDGLVRTGILAHRDHVWLGSAMCIRARGADLATFAAIARSWPDPANTYQDWPLAAWLACLPGGRCGYLPAKLLRYRLHGANHSGDARTAERAARNWVRTANTLRVEADIQRRFREGAPEIAMLHGRAAVASWLSDLYAGRDRTRTLLAYPRHVRNLHAGGTLLKDSVRAVLLLALGPKCAVRLLHGTKR